MDPKDRLLRLHRLGNPPRGAREPVWDMPPEPAARDSIAAMPDPGPERGVDQDPPLARAQRGDRDAMAQVLAEHENQLFAVCVRMVGRGEAADLCQDAMIKIIQGLPTFDGRSQLATWMTRITMNVCLSHLRRARLRRHASLDRMGEHAPDRGAGGAPPGARSAFSPPGGGGSGGATGGETLEEPGADQSVQSSERQRRVLAALNRLEPEQRALLVLRDVQGLGYEAISEVLGVALGTVKSRIFRARAAMRGHMESPGPAADEDTETT